MFLSGALPPFPCGLRCGGSLLLAAILLLLLREGDAIRQSATVRGQAAGAAMHGSSNRSQASFTASYLEKKQSSASPETAPPSLHEHDKKEDTEGHLAKEHEELAASTMRRFWLLALVSYVACMLSCVGAWMLVSRSSSDEKESEKTEKSKRKGTFDGMAEAERQMTDKDKERTLRRMYKDRWIQETRDGNLRTAALTLANFNCALMTLRLMRFWYLPIWTRTVVPFWVHCSELSYLALVLLVMALCSWWPYGNRGVLYWPTFFTYFLYILASGLPPLHWTCRDLEIWQKNYADGDPDVPWFLQRDYNDCSLQGQSSKQLSMTWLLLMPWLITRQKMLNFLWAYVLLYIVWSILYQELTGDAQLHGLFEIAIGALGLSVSIVVARSKKYYLEKSQRNKFVSDLEHKAACERMYLILENIVPQHVIVPMIRNQPIAETFDTVSILFIVISDFDMYTSSLAMSPQDLLRFLNDKFTQFDAICAANRVTKIETVGEEYVACVGVLPSDSKEGAGHSVVVERLFRAANKILQLQSDDVKLKMGVHTGPIVAGVIGQKLPRYRLFGDTINTAARMMQKGVVGRLQFGAETHAHLPSNVNVSLRGDVEMKGKGLVKTWLLDDIVEENSAATPSNRVRFDPASALQDTWNEAGELLLKAPILGGLLRSSANDKTKSILLPRPDALEEKDDDDGKEVGSDDGESSSDDDDDDANDASPTAHKSSSGGKPFAARKTNVKRKEWQLQRTPAEFKQLLLNLEAQDVQFARPWVWLSQKDGFTPEMEKDWYQWHHVSTFCKKLSSRLLLQSMAIIATTIVEILALLVRGDFTGVHLKQYTWTYFCCRGGVLLIMAVLWLLAFVERSLKWLEKEPFLVQCLMMVSSLLISSLMFVSYNAIAAAIQVAYVSSMCCGWFMLVYFVMARQHPFLFYCSLLFLAFAGLLMKDHPAENVLLNSMQYTYSGKGLFVISCLLTVVIAHNEEQTSRSRYKVKRAVELMEARIQGVLNTLMPPLVVDEFRDLPMSAPPPSHHYDLATIAQSDLCGFTKLASTRTPGEVVSLIGDLFGLFDKLTDEYGIYKVETVGDAYIAGQAEQPLTEQNSPSAVVVFGFAMVRVTAEWSQKHGFSVTCRVGVHHGPCIGGVVGSNMQRYHLFGSLMSGVEVLESTAPEGRVQVSSACRRAVLDEVNEKPSSQGVGLSFRERDGAALTTSKGEVHDYEEVGGRTYVVDSVN
eukprot:TRINITY_DN65096_c0_g1_i1.p1 TRINITY_DN65096_c0_g1~~TRINITY_DN65096_c0_g1_i1.p1  ORF type:complete len:1220 (+),score=298.09 TRINITY_DN65096_c0_g1_i1:104-3763(+)